MRQKGDVVKAPKIPQIMATNKKRIIRNKFFFFQNLRIPVTIATTRTSQRNPNVVPSP